MKTDHIKALQDKEQKEEAGEAVSQARIDLSQTQPINPLTPTLVQDPKNESENELELKNQASNSESTSKDVSEQKPTPPEKSKKPIGDDNRLHQSQDNKKGKKKRQEEQVSNLVTPP